MNKSINDKMWEDAVEFHGHACPGLATGFVAAKYAIEKFNLEEISRSERGKRLVCISENDACGVDAIQLLLGCSVGKGNLLFKFRGKQAFSIYDRETGSAIRIVSKNLKRDMERDERIKILINESPKNVFRETEIQDEIPEKAKIMKSYDCSNCNEKTMESMVRLQDEEVLCLECYDEYSRIL